MDANKEKITKRLFLSNEADQFDAILAKIGEIEGAHITDVFKFYRQALVRATPEVWDHMLNSEVAIIPSEVDVLDEEVFQAMRKDTFPLNVRKIGASSMWWPTR